MKRLYVASRTRHAPMWLTLRDSGVNIISSWIDEAAPGATADPVDLFRRCIAEAAGADALIFYAEAHDWDGMTGAPAEVGAALGADRAVFFVGVHPYPLLLKHPRVVCCPTIAEAIRLAERPKDVGFYSVLDDRGAVDLRPDIKAALDRYYDGIAALNPAFAATPNANAECYMTCGTDLDGCAYLGLAAVIGPLGVSRRARLLHDTVHEAAQALVLGPPPRIT